MELSRAYMRRLLEGVLTSDSDLDAFCLDYFPHVYRRFSAGMDRVRKHNLLLEQVDLEQLYNALRDTEPAGLERLQAVLTGGAPPRPGAAPTALATAEEEDRELLSFSAPQIEVPRIEHNVVAGRTLRPQPGLPLTDIFRTAGQPEYTFVEPAQAAQLKLRLRTMGEGLLVEGPSGVGKTTAVERMLKELGQRSRTVWLSAGSEQDRSALDEHLRNDFKQGGFLVVDDFHHLDAARQARLTALIKFLADRNRRDAKVTLIGINSASHSLLSYFPDVFGRFATVQMGRQPEAKVDELIRKGEAVANVVFKQRAEFVAAARGSFVIAQRLCLEAIMLEGITDAQAAPVVIPHGPGEAISQVRRDLKAKFHGLLSTFAAYDSSPPPRGACLLLLWHLAHSEDAHVSLDEVRYQDAQLAEAFSWLMASNLGSFFEQNPAVARLLYYNRHSAVLSAEDPQLEFYLRHLDELDWLDFARKTGHAVESWDPEGGPKFKPRATGVPAPSAVPPPAAPPAAPVASAGMTGGKVTTSGAPSAWVLHLSDLHFGALGTEAPWYDQLAADLRYELSLNRLDAVIVSGDISNRAEPEEYQAAQRFFQQLMSEFSLPPQKIVLVPGNHDSNWRLSRKAYTPVRRIDYKGALVPGLYIDGGEHYVELRSEGDYKERFEPFADFYEAVRLEPYSLEYAEQATLHHFPEQNLLVLGLNSAWELDHHFKERAGINPAALSRALQQIRNTSAYAQCLKLAVWHHALDGAGQDRIKDTGFLEQLAQAGFRLGLHGHIHRADNTLFRYYRQAGGGGLELLCAGTFGAPTREWVPGYPLQYQLLEFSGNVLRVHTRRREGLNGAWKPDARWLSGPGKDPLPRYEIEL